ncbi:hypothetical protein [Vibrio sp. S9_S30]|nr:hypothetical protein [Vibrio sp. S9_S30]
MLPLRTLSGKQEIGVRGEKDNVDEGKEKGRDNALLPRGLSN